MIPPILLPMHVPSLPSSSPDTRSSSAWRAAAPIPALALLGLAVGLPADPGALFGPGHLGLSLEVTALFGLAALAARRGLRISSRAVWGLAALVLLVVLVRVADLSARAFAGRDFEPGYDLTLLPALWEVMAASLPAPLLAAGILLPLLAVAAGLRLLLGRGLRGLEEPGGRRAFAAVLALALIGQGVSMAGGTRWQPFQAPDRTAASLAQDLGERVAHAADLRRESAQALARDPVAAIPPDRLLAALRGRDVIVVWVESYGISALTDPRHAAVGERLARMETELGEAGFSAVSGVLDSPVLGGRSWLAHGTFRAGIRQPEVPVQSMVLASGRRSLVHAFGLGGWRTVAVMPGLRSPWPEGVLWGFDRVLRQPDLPYRGPAFGWSHMPDQAVLATVEGMGLRAGPEPVYLEVVLTSSHAPWTPNPPWLEPGERAGMIDGGAYAGRVDDPDYSRMAAGYAGSVDYSLRAVADWLAAEVADDALVIVLGDHPPVTWIAEDRGRAVPVHVLSRDPAVLARFRAWGFDTGMVPAAGPPLFGLEGVMERFLDAFSPEAGPAAS